jgi:glutathione S-transferase
LEYALVLLSGIFVYFVHHFLGHRVGSARKRFGIQYPNLYESTDAEGKLKTPFNNYQRGHMNMVENFAPFLFLLFGASLFNPIHAAICGFVWGTGRIVYAIGYSVSPSTRFFGEFFMLAELYMLYLIGRGCYTPVRTYFGI